MNTAPTKIATIKVGHQTLSQWQQQCRQYMLSIEPQFDRQHRIDHLDRVLVNALQIAEPTDAKLEVIVPAVMLHDCVAISKQSPQRRKASTISARHAKKLLNTWGYPDNYVPAIGAAIASHSFSAKIKAVSHEAKIVQDADRLDSLGAIGIARCLMLGEHFGSALYDSHDPFAVQRDLNDKQFSLDHFHTKLLHLVDRFQTPEGRALAQQRTQFMRHYLQQLANEITTPID